jgi:hypothetical protein
MNSVAEQFLFMMVDKSMALRVGLKDLRFSLLKL